jgi:hypothetical protein
VKRAVIPLILVTALVLLGLSFATSRPVSAPQGEERELTIARGMVIVDFQGARSNVTQPFAVPSGTDAWAAIRQALSDSNVGHTDFGAGLGVMVTELYGVSAQGNHFWEFRINGEPATVGVSNYPVKDGDRLELRYSPF